MRLTSHSSLKICRLFPPLAKVLAAGHLVAFLLQIA